MRLRAVVPWPVALVAPLFLARAALAGEADARVAQALFDEARQLMDQKRWSEACPKLAESQRLDPGGGTLLNLALCHAYEGKIATALVEYHTALAAATRDGRQDRERLARSSIAGLDRDVPRVTVVVAGAARVEGLEVKVDETALPRAAWGVATPVDPGTHVISASVPGRTPWSSFITVGVGEQRAVEIPPFVQDGEPRPAAPAPLATPDAPSHAADNKTRANPVFWAVFGATALAVGTMAVTGVMALTEKNNAKDNCLPDRNFCRDAASADAADSARTLGWVSTGALAAAVVGTVVLLVLPSRIRATPARVGLGPGLGLAAAF